MVSKAGLSESAEVALVSQFTQYPKALGMSSAVAGILAIVPGTPFLPFILLSALTGGAAWVTNQRHQKAMRHSADMAAEAEGASAPVAEEPITSALKMDMVRLELGYGLLSMISGEPTSDGTDQSSQTGLSH